MDVSPREYIARAGRLNHSINVENFIVDWNFKQRHAETVLSKSLIGSKAVLLIQNIKTSR